MLRENFRQPEQISASEKIKNLLKDIAENYRQEGLPVDNNCRIDISKLNDYYRKEIIEQDIRKIENIKKRIKEDERNKEKTNKERKGERLERLKTVIFNKFFAKDAIVVRSSEYDDIINGVDNILVDRKTGKAICAFDEVCSINKEIFENKKKKILEKNENGGASLKYFPKIEDGKISFGRVNNIPIFYIALPEDVLIEAEKRTSSFFKEITSYEEKLFAYFWNSLYNQAELFYLDPKVNDEILSNLSFFKDISPPKYK